MKRLRPLISSKVHFSRRDFLRVGSLGFLGISLSQYLELQSLLAAAGVDVARRAKAQACILLWLQGGPSQVDTWDPKTNSNFKPISTNVDGIQISELLPRTAKYMDKLAIIRSMRSEEIDHPEAIHYAMTGHRQNPAMQFPSLGSITAREMGSREGLPPYVIVPEMYARYLAHFKSAFIGPQYDPMVVPDPNKKDFRIPDLSLSKSITLERIENRRYFQGLVDQIYRQKAQIAEFSNLHSFTDQALNMLLSPAVQSAFDVSQEPQKIREAYGLNGFGQSVLLARRLVEAGCRFVTASGFKRLNVWDSHADNDNELRDKLVPPFEQALTVLLDELEQRGLFESTVVIAMGEFGRTPHINPANGRDHWPHCWSLVLGGGGLRGGQVVGASDEKGAQVVDRMVTVGDLFATIYKAFGIDWEKTYMTPIGRPVKLANSIGDKTGVPIKELI